MQKDFTLITSTIEGCNGSIKRGRGSVGDGSVERGSGVLEGIQRGRGSIGGCDGFIKRGRGSVGGCER